MASDPNLQVLGAAYIQHKCYSDVTAKKQVACCPVDTPTAHLPGDPQADLAHPILPRAFSAENGWEGRMCTHLHTSAHTCVHLPTSAHTCIYLHTSAYTCTHIYHLCTPSHMCIHLYTLASSA